MKFPGDTYPAVSPLAIQWGTDGAFVWAVEDGKAKRMPVRIVQRNTETRAGRCRRSTAATWS